VNDSTIQIQTTQLNFVPSHDVWVLAELVGPNKTEGQSQVQFPSTTHTLSIHSLSSIVASAFGTRLVCGLYDEIVLTKTAIEPEDKNVEQQCPRRNMSVLLSNRDPGLCELI